MTPCQRAFQHFSSAFGISGSAQGYREVIVDGGRASGSRDRFFEGTDGFHIFSALNVHEPQGVESRGFRSETGRKRRPIGLRMCTSRFQPRFNVPPRYTTLPW